MFFQDGKRNCNLLLTSTLGNKERLKLLRTVLSTLRGGQPPNKLWTIAPPSDTSASSFLGRLIFLETTDPLLIVA